MSKQMPFVNMAGTHLGERGQKAMLSVLAAPIEPEDMAAPEVMGVDGLVIVDARIPEVIKHLRELAKLHDRPLVVQDYVAYREKHARSLPALTTIYRIFSSWPNALVAAGLTPPNKPESTRTSDELLIAALEKAAVALNTQILSSHAYDEYRKTNAPDLPSSSVIRKWLGHWGEAVQRAGLETSERSGPHRHTLVEIIAALRSVKHEVDGLLTVSSYHKFQNSLPEGDRKDWPDVTHILSLFPTWEAALKSAAVDQSDELHPESGWSAEEVRRHMRLVKRVIGHFPSEREYANIQRNSVITKPWPTWETIQYLLAS